MRTEIETPEEKKFYKEFEANIRPFMDSWEAICRGAGLSEEEILANKKQRELDLDLEKRRAFERHQSLRANRQRYQQDTEAEQKLQHLPIWAHVCFGLVIFAACLLVLVW